MMTLKPVKKAISHRYPPFEEYWRNRHKDSAKKAICAGLALAAGIFSSCDSKVSNESQSATPPYTPPPAYRDTVSPPEPPDADSEFLHDEGDISDNVPPPSVPSFLSEDELKRFNPPVSRSIKGRIAAPAPPRQE